MQSEREPMTTGGIESREAMATEYLGSLERLSGELERAMQAIAHNTLSELEDSVSNQRMLSSALSGLAEHLWAPGTSAADQAAGESAEDKDTMRRIRKAAQTLDGLNRRYAALLQHSSRSVAMMASLFSSFQGQIQEGSGPRLKHQTWSCQM